MRFYLLPALTGIILWMAACNPQSNPAQTSTESISEKVERLASETYKEQTAFLNESESCVLVVNTTSYKPNQADRNILFHVFSLKDESVILKDEISKGYVYWENDENLLVKKYPGEIDDDRPNQFGYRFNVINKTRQAIK